MYDLAIIGGGPAGTAAGVYAARKKLSTVLITPEFGGQSVVSFEVQNWIGTKALSGAELAENFKDHLKAYADDSVTIKESQYVTSITKEDDGFTISTKKENFRARTVFIATGSSRRKLDIPGAAEFENKGITYCASCDGPVFTGMDVAVIGGGNAGFETAAQLLAYAKSVTLINRSERFRADEVTVAKVLSHPNMSALTNITLLEIKAAGGDKEIIYTQAETEGKQSLKVTGVFVEIGLIPNTDFLKGVVELNAHGSIIVDPRTQQTSLPGIWAAGDCTDGKYHQNNIAAGDGVKALEDIYVNLKAR